MALAVLLLPAAAGEFSAEAELERNLNRFAGEYNVFCKLLKGGRLDMARAKRLSELWHRVEDSGMWPKKQQPKKTKKRGK